VAYQEYSITTLDDVPALVRSFAANMGWNVVGGNLRHPNYDGAGPGGLAFEIYTVSNALNHDLFFRCTTDPSRSARIRGPIWSTTVAPFSGYKVAPTKLFLIGMLDPEPYIAVVVEFGYNLYRHLYLGYMEKQGTYGGGSVLGACTGVEVFHVRLHQHRKRREPLAPRLGLHAGPFGRLAQYRRHLGIGEHRYGPLGLLSV